MKLISDSAGLRQAGVMGGDSAATLRTGLIRSSNHRSANRAELTAGLVVEDDEADR